MLSQIRMLTRAGLVGGWIVQHLLMRGEDPQSIRIVDLSTPTRPEVKGNNIHYVRTDITDIQATKDAFEKPWPDRIRSRPLTVFHCAAYISPKDRHAVCLPIYAKINVKGTKNVLEAARAAKASIFVATSSGSVALTPPSYFPWPWQRWPKNVYQFLPNAEPTTLDAPLESFAACYAWTKAQAESMVRKANDPSSGFLTGAIRPAHAIYGHGVENPSSITWDYCRRGGSPSWIPHVVTHFVNAQNVSVGHLAYEDALVNRKNSGGKAYCVTDPNPPLRYGQLYTVLKSLAHPLTPMNFPYVPHIIMLLAAYVVEAYVVFRLKYMPSLPPVEGDLSSLQPAMFQLCTLHIIYTDTAAQKEIGYRAPIQTLEGFTAAILDWNRKVEEKAQAKIDKGKGGEVHVQNGSTVPKGPNVH